MTSQPAEPTQGDTIEAAVAQLDTLAERPTEEHPAVYEAIHRVLRDQLAGPRA